jgi:translation initiation factor IF-1
VGFDPAVSGRKVIARVVEELPSLTYRVALERNQTVLAHAAGQKQRNFVRLLPGELVELELSPHDLTRGRILRKVSGPRP